MHLKLTRNCKLTILKFFCLSHVPFIYEVLSWFIFHPINSMRKRVGRTCPDWTHKAESRGSRKPVLHAPQNEWEQSAVFLCSWPPHLLSHVVRSAAGSNLTISSHLSKLCSLHFSLCVCVHMCMESLSLVQLFVTPWTVARQAPLSMGFSRQEHWNGLPFPPPGDLPDPGIKSVYPVASALACRFFTTELPGKLTAIFFSGEKKSSWDPNPTILEINWAPVSSHFKLILCLSALTFWWFQAHQFLGLNTFVYNLGIQISLPQKPEW